MSSRNANRFTNHRPVRDWAVTSTLLLASAALLSLPALAVEPLIDDAAVIDLESFRQSLDEEPSAHNEVAPARYNRLRAMQLAGKLEHPHRPDLAIAPGAVPTVDGHFAAPSDCDCCESDSCGYPGCGGPLGDCCNEPGCQCEPCCGVGGYGCNDRCCGYGRGPRRRRGRAFAGPYGTWASVDYLLWWVEGYAAPPLVTTSVAGTAQEDAGVLGQPGTSVLFGGRNLTDGARSGVRVGFGFWLDPCETLGLQAGYFGLAEENSNFSASSPGSPILARPFFNVEPGSEGQDSELVAFPNLLSGEIRVLSDSHLQGAEVMFRRNLCQRCGNRVDFLAGWRYNELDEDLLVSDFKTVIGSGTGLAVGTTLEEFDRFTARNTFHGFQLGCVSHYRCCRWTLDVITKVAIGNTHSRVSINGEATSTTPVAGAPPQVDVTDAGMLAQQQNNIGSYSSDDLTVVPELGVTLGWDWTCCTRLQVGYTFMYWSRVMRPGDQIDPNLNLSQLAPGGLVGIARPEFPGQYTDMWAHGLNLGLHFRF